MITGIVGVKAQAPGFSVAPFVGCVLMLSMSFTFAMFLSVVAQTIQPLVREHERLRAEVENLVEQLAKRESKTSP